MLTMADVWIWVWQEALTPLLESLVPPSNDGLVTCTRPCIMPSPFSCLITIPLLTALEACPLVHVCQYQFIAQQKLLIVKIQKPLPCLSRSYWCLSQESHSDSYLCSCSQTAIIPLCKHHSIAAASLGNSVFVAKLLVVFLGKNSLLDYMVSSMNCYHSLSVPYLKTPHSLWCVLQLQSGPVIAVLLLVGPVASVVPAVLEPMFSHALLVSEVLLARMLIPSHLMDSFFQQEAPFNGIRYGPCLFKSAKK